MVEAIGDGTGAGAVSTTEIPLACCEDTFQKAFCESFDESSGRCSAGSNSRSGLDIVEGLATGMEKAYRRLDRDYAQDMEILERGYPPPDLE